jgi:hypothetical protein
MTIRKKIFILAAAEVSPNLGDRGVQAGAT